MLPIEVADEAALQAMTQWDALPVFADGVYRMQSSEDRDRGEPLQSLWGFGNRDLNNFVCKGDVADVVRSRVPLHFDLDKCPESYTRGVVLARFEGSGRLTRIWMTAASIRRKPADREVLRIYVDDQLAIETPLAAALDGSAGEIFAPPFGAGSTHYMAWYYPVVFSSKLIVSIDKLAGDDLYFHQTAVVMDASPKKRQAAKKRLDARSDAKALLRSTVPYAYKPSTYDIALDPGGQVEHRLIGPATIAKTRVRFRHDDLAKLAKLDVRVHWDDDSVPAIELPLADLFMLSDAVPETSTLAMSASKRGDEVELSLNLPMPFRRQARFGLHNRGTQPVRVKLLLETNRTVPSAPFGLLHVQHNETTDQETKAHPLVSAKGRGRLAGVCMALHGHGLVERGRKGHPMHFLEGDELAIIDGERAIAGTGTEDYFNGAFYFEEGPASTPFAQTWGIAARVPSARDQGKASACRWHVLSDTIDFQRSLEMEMEIGPGRPAVLNRYRSVAYLYQ
jgi:hypothetical protein